MPTRRSILNKEVSITALYFLNRRPLKSFPRRMEFEGRAYNFIESGLQYQLNVGGRIVRFFDMTDGISDYRLRQVDQSWTLVSITRGRINSGRI